MENFSKAIKDWAEARELMVNPNPVKQWVKLSEEMGEMFADMYKGQSIVDDIGDQNVVLNVLMAQYGKSLDDMAETGNQFDYEATYTAEALKDMTDVNLLGAIIMDVNANLGKWIMLDDGDPVEEGELTKEEGLVLTVYNYHTLLSHMAACIGSTLAECSEYAYNEISNRQGPTRDGGFHKNEEEAA